MRMSGREMGWRVAAGTEGGGGGRKDGVTERRVWGALRGGLCGREGGRRGGRR